MFNSILDPILGPLLSLGYAWTIIIICFILTLLTTIIYKLTTDQELLKKLKLESKDLQKKIKASSKDPKKAQAIQKQMMEKQLVMMKQTFKSMIYTFVPIIIVYGWLLANVSYIPIEPGSNFTVSANFKEGTFGTISMESNPPDLIFFSPANQSIENNQVNWILNGAEGEYMLTFIFSNRKFEKKVVISDKDFESPISKVKDSELSSLSLGNKRIRPLGSFNIFGWYPGLIFTYIIFSLIFSQIFRKIMKLS
jgi:uncharacterized membrane protein (DUF106 family)